MESPTKTPEQLLQFRALQQVLADKRSGAYAIPPDASVLSALQLMADKNIGFVVVEEKGTLVGVLSERDYARKVILRGRSSRDTPVREIMTKDVVTVTPGHTVPQCMELMQARGFRHLPVVVDGKVIGVLSIRDLLKETIRHHERLIQDMALERLSMLSGGSTY